MATRLDHILGVPDIFSLCLLTAVLTLANSFLGDFQFNHHKINWIVGWLWLNYVNTFISIILSEIDSIHWYKRRKNKYSHNLCWHFVSGKLGFGHGKVMEKSWNFFLIFLWEPWNRRQTEHTYMFVFVRFDALTQASDFESKGDKLSSSAECRIRTQRVYGTESPADWIPADKLTELSRVKLKTWTQ